MSTEIGHLAEAKAAAFIVRRGQTIIATNWRNRWSEVDIISRDVAGSIHFIEVKYRRKDASGTAFEYITADKAHRLRRAALAWVTQRNFDGDYQIDVIAISGDLDNPEIELIDNAIGY